VEGASDGAAREGDKRGEQHAREEEQHGGCRSEPLQCDPGEEYGDRDRPEREQRRDALDAPLEAVGYKRGKVGPVDRAPGWVGDEHAAVWRSQVSGRVAKRVRGHALLDSGAPGGVSDD
jgi:hypothetical protein